MGYLIVLFSVVSFLLLYFRKYEAFLLFLFFTTLLLLLLHLFLNKTKNPHSPEEILKTLSINVIVSFFVLFPLHYLCVLKELNNLYPLILLFAIWASDVSAYFTGKTFGKRKLCPFISPGKTVEGLSGAIFASSLVFALAKGTLGLDLPSAIFFGASLGFLGQAGDIFESAFKRLFGFKDSSSILPGHGGILDRMDSFIFATPFFYKVLSFKS